MAANKQYTKEELTRIINDELKSFVKNELEREVKKMLSKQGSDARKEVNDIVKNGLSKLAEFLWVRKGVWQSDIK